MKSSESLASPGSMLEELYRTIHRIAMLGLPILNPGLEIEAVGFKQFHGLWLGILITPWFMNLVLLSGTEPCPILAEGESQSWKFPGGTLKFDSSFEAEIGKYQVCSLFSPMGQFTSQEEARDAAQTILQSLFTETVQVEAEPVVKKAVGPLAEMRAAVAAPMTKRDFLRGSFLPGRKREPQG